MSDKGKFVVSKQVGYPSVTASHLHIPSCVGISREVLNKDIDIVSKEMKTHFDNELNRMGLRFIKENRLHKKHSKYTYIELLYSNEK